MLFKTTILAILCFGLFGCTTQTTPEKLQALLEQYPGILTGAIEANSLVFMESLQRAQQQAAVEYAEREEQRAAAMREAEFANPKQPVIDATRAVRGKLDAPITIVVYSDFQCPYCERGAQVLDQLRAAYCDQLRIVFKHLPLSFHPYAEPAARYFEAIARQGSEPAYMFHDLLFANQQRLGDEGEAYLLEAAGQLGIDLDRFNTDLEDPALDEILLADQAEAAEFGFNGTPAFLVNGISISGALPAEEFVQIIDRVSGGAIKPGIMPELGTVDADGEHSCQ